MSSRLHCALISLLMLVPTVAPAGDASGRWLANQPLRDPSPLALHDEIVRRIVSPSAA
jgi:hypothetical protein